MLSFRTQKLISALCVFFLTLLLFLPSVGNDFVDWDDYAFVTQNALVHEFSLKSLGRMFTSFHAAVWHPLTWVSHASDIALFGMNASPHRLVNILLHCLNAVIFCFLVFRLIEISHTRAKTQADAVWAVVVATASAGLFALHPLRVESVVWVAERKDVLCAFFFLLSISFYLKYVTAPENRTAYFSSVGFCAAALLSKPMAVSIPFVLLLLDYCPLDRLTAARLKHVLWEKIPFAALSAGAVFMNMLATTGATVPWSYVPLPMRIMNFHHATLCYMKQLIWPSVLLPLYQMDRSVDYFSAPFIVAMLLVALLTGLAVVLALRGRRLWAAVWFYFLITVTPVSGMFMSYRHSMADRYTYLPMLGFCLLFGLGVGRLWKAARSSSRPRLAYSAVAAACVAVLAGFWLKTADQIKVWKNSETLWSHIAEKADYVPDLAFFSLGKIMEQKGDHAQAIRHYETAVELNPGDMRFLGRLAAALAAKGDHARAREKLEIVRRNALSADICVSVGRTYLILGDFDEADRMFRKALEMDPRNGAALTMMIADRLKRGDTEGARALHAEGIAKGIPLTLNLNAVMSAVEAQSHVE